MQVVTLWPQRRLQEITSRQTGTSMSAAPLAQHPFLVLPCRVLLLVTTTTVFLAVRYTGKAACVHDAFNVGVLTWIFVGP